MALIKNFNPLRRNPRVFRPGIRFRKSEIHAADEISASGRELWALPPTAARLERLHSEPLKAYIRVAVSVYIGKLEFTGFENQDPIPGFWFYLD